jgi:uncharacterized spore protein YtfJ
MKAMDLNELVKGLLSELEKVSKSDAVVGTVRDAGKAKVLPLSKVSIGFGTGTADIGGKSQRQGSEKDAGVEGGGVGGALIVEPKAFVVVGEDGIPHMLALKRGKTAVIRHGVEIGPADGNSHQLSGRAPPQLEGKAKK